jgi:hypothetical protein
MIRLSAITRAQSLHNHCIISFTQFYFDLQDLELDHLLSVKALWSVKDLALGVFLDILQEPVWPTTVWPTTWSQLTNLTRLKFHCKDENEMMHLPDFLTELRSLRDLELAIRFRQLDDPGEGFLVLIASCLPQLTRLFVDVIIITNHDWSGLISDKFDHERLEKICHTISQKVPRMICTSLVDKKSQTPPIVSLTLSCDG